MEAAMALVIDNPETERLVEELARKTGRTPAEIVAAAIREELRKPATPQLPPISDEERIRIAKRDIREMQDRIAASATLDMRSADEILGYDEFGVPR